MVPPRDARLELIICHGDQARESGRNPKPAGKDDGTRACRLGFRDGDDGPDHHAPPAELAFIFDGVRKGARHLA